MASLEDCAVVVAMEQRAALDRGDDGGDRHHLVLVVFSVMLALLM